MKFQAPLGVTALSCAGEEIVPDALGCFEAAEKFASELQAHGCLPAPEPRTEKPAETPRAQNRGRAEKAS